MALNQLGRTPMGVARGMAKAVLSKVKNEEPGVPTLPSAGDEIVTSILEGATVTDAEGMTQGEAPCKRWGCSIAYF
jgi:hypothetical protein